jgi:4-amino-4-deoxy-L-arabinose transferase-like glycosyltransferase
MVFIFLSLKDPHGGYDGWEIWNMHARFMFRGGGHWSDYLSENFHYSHPDYPLLISASIARGWQYIGHDTVIIPILLSMFFTFATVGLIFSSIAVLRSKSQGLLAGLILLATPFFVTNGATQYADIPLGFFFLATVVLFTLQERLSVDNYGLLTLAGLMTGFAAWTKNEGLLFIVAVMVAHFAVTIHFKGWIVYFRQAQSFLTGLFPVLAIVIYFKMMFAPQNDWLSAQRLYSTIERFTDSSRYIQVLKAFARGVFHFGDWHPLVNIPFLLCFYALILGIHVESNERSSIFNAVLVFVLMLGGYFSIYITTPHPLLWHLSTSLDRLFLQLWPTFVFSYFLVVRTVEKALISKES